jgi:hypothetical protein
MTYDELRAALSAYLKRTDPETIANEPISLELSRKIVAGFFFPRESEEVASLLPVDGVAPLPADFGRAISVGADLAYMAPRAWNRLILASPRELAGKFTLEAHERGKLCHWGRVNSRRRIRFLVSEMRAGRCWIDSLDGSGWSRFAEVRIPKFIRWADQAINRWEGSLF